MKNIMSLFGGIECAYVAIKKLGIDVGKYYSAEVDKYAIQISEKNHPGIIHLGDVKSIGKDKFFNKLKKIDLLIGGSPCQDLSIAGNRKGLNGERSSLFYEYVRILQEMKPKYFILENVNSMSKESRDTISRHMGMEPIMINASLVSAQNRKRLFWVGKLVRGKYVQVDIPQPEDKNIFLKDVLEHGKVDRDKSYCIDASYYKGANWKQYKDKGRRQLVVDEKGNEKLKSNTIRTSGRGRGLGDKHNWDTIRIGNIGSNAQAHRVYSPEGKSVALSALGGGQGAKTGLYITQTPRGKNKGGDHRKKSPTVTSSSFEHNNHVTDGYVVRKLTPVECERLQCLPDGYTEGVSNTQRYKMLGNAFNVDVVAHIIKHLNLK